MLSLLIPAAISLATKAVPWIVGKIAGDNAEKTAKSVIDTVEKITGKTINSVEDLDEAQELLERDPTAWAQFQKDMANISLELEREDTKRYEEYQKTLRGDVLGKDEITRTWRPKFALAIAHTWKLMFYAVFISFMSAIVCQIFQKEPKVTIDLVSRSMSTLMDAVWPMWGVALSVIGVYVKKRSDDKKVVSMNGSEGSNVIEGIINAIKK